MLPLKSLPKILKHASPHGHSSLPSTSSPLSYPQNGNSRGALAAIKYNDLETSSQISSQSSAVEAMEAEEKELRERLMVLEEQKFMVGEMLAEARKKRRFDEVNALVGNLEDLGREVDTVRGMVEGLDFRGVYTGDAGGGGGGVLGLGR